MRVAAAASGQAGWDAAGAAGEVRAFLLAHAAVELWEGGRRVARLEGERSGYGLSGEAGRLVCHFWSADANLVRRVVGIATQGTGRLRLQCLRLGQSQPSPLVLVAGAGGGAASDAGSRREEFRLAVMAAAERDWHGWRCEAAQGGAASGRSGVQKLVFRRQQGLVPCVAVDEEEHAGAVGAALAQALVWAEQVRQRWPRGVVKAVRLVLPPGAEEAIGRLRSCLRAAPPIECYRLDRAAGALELAAASDTGNFVSSLKRAPSLEAPTGAGAALLAEIREYCPQATWETGPDGAGRARVYGLEIAREATGAEALAAPFTFGCGREQSPLLEATRLLFLRFLRDVAEQRVAGRDRRFPLYALQPEGWMEHLLRSDPRALDAQVDPRSVYAQVPVSGPGPRDVLDLLAVDRDGRLLVWELKADEDLGFPLQALDYWRQVRRHQRAGDFERLGYFPGVALSPLPPRLWLVAPALRWHPQTELLGRWIAPEVPWTRLGLNEEWRHGIQVVYRKDTAHG